MNCYKHPDKESAVNCSLCGEPICEECLVEIAGRPYCKDCVNKIVTQSILEKADVAPKAEEKIETSPEVETIEPVQEEVETIEPVKEEAEVEAEAPQKPEKAPENFETDYEYETEYVETYDEGGAEDNYYENPEPSEPIVINPSPEETQAQAQAVPDAEGDSNLEEKYERYLDDLYFDEPAQEAVRDTRGAERPQQYPYDEQNAPRRGRRGRRQAQRDMDYVPQGQAYINQDYDDGLIIPAHSSQSQQYANESYEDLKRRIERNFAEEEEQNKRGLLRRSRRSDGYNEMNIDNIQEMHNFKEEDEDGLSIAEIILTVILIVLIIGVILYIVYLFTLSGDYASFQEAIMGLFSDPQTFTTNLMNFI